MVVKIYKIIRWSCGIAMLIIISIGIGMYIKGATIRELRDGLYWYFMSAWAVSAANKWILWFFHERKYEKMNASASDRYEIITLQSLREDILKGIALADAELIKRKAGIEGESTIDQIENVILPELRQLLEKVDNEELPPRSERNLQSVLYFFKIWEWDRQNPTDLYIQLERINHHYKKVWTEL